MLHGKQFFWLCSIVFANNSNNKQQLYTSKILLLFYFTFNYWLMLYGKQYFDLMFIFQLFNSLTIILFCCCAFFTVWFIWTIFFLVNVSASTFCCAFLTVWFLWTIFLLVSIFASTFFLSFFVPLINIFFILNFIFLLSHLWSS